LDRRNGPLVLKFETGQLLRFDVAPDAESLAVFTTAWEDPFGDTLEGENAEFVDEHGKWTLFGVDDQPPYVSLVGKELRQVQPVKNQFGSLSGAKLGFEGGTVLYFLTAADEAWVMQEDFDPATWDMSVEAAH
jgi:hypothetical protein